jgi:hypothetical protein
MFIYLHHLFNCVTEKVGTYRCWSYGLQRLVGFPSSECGESTFPRNVGIYLCPHSVATQKINRHLHRRENLRSRKQERIYFPRYYKLPNVATQLLALCFIFVRCAVQISSRRQAMLT